MLNLKQKLNFGINAASKLIPFGLLKYTSQQNLILPFYHSVSNSDIPHIKNLYHTKSASAFVQDLDFLLKHYQPIDYKQFCAVAKGDLVLKKPSFLLSFDDGLKEFDEIIAPILLQKGIPAICFLNSAFVDNKDLFFRYKASLILNEINKNSSLESEISLFFENDKPLKDNVLAVSFEQKNILDQIALSINFSFENYLKLQKPYLESAQIKKLIARGFYFGAHSVNHPEYQYISLVNQIAQTKESIDFVAQKFALDYRIFSFPFTDFNVSMRYFEALKNEKIADFTFGTAGQKKDIINTNFQRIAFENNKLSAQQILKKELLYYNLKALINKNTIQRKL